MATNYKTLDFQNVRTDDRMAVNIANTWQRWKGARSKWEEQKKELRDYLFATDTRTTSNSKLPWKNSTTMPKLCQIRDNLHANYMSALFPHEDWFSWEGDSKADVAHDVKQAVESYIRQKLRESGFYDTCSKIIYDYIDSGVCLGEVNYEHHVAELEGAPSTVVYSGPRLNRISYMDMVFDISATNFDRTPKITRTLMTMGQLSKMAAVTPEEEGDWYKAGLEYARDIRRNVGEYKSSDVKKSSAITIDGFGTLYDYYMSGTVELLEFEGDIFDTDSGEFLENHKIVVIDRDKVIYKGKFTSWTGISNKHFCTWRPRPDVLIGMGPLDNLVGLQYRIDHLENLKADVFDQIAVPMAYQRGYVEDWNYGPGEKIIGDAESHVEFLRPDATALNADMQIARHMEQMEELAGAPKQAMGIRTPGEKTAFEVSELQNAASRIFQSKLVQFERNFLEPVLNQFLSSARQNLEGRAETVKVLDDDYGVKMFLDISADDLKARGKLIPKGARHFARKAQLMQNLVGFANSSLYTDPAVQAHVSGYKIAQAIEELLEFERFDLIGNNIRLAEQQETQAMAQVAEQQNMQQGMTNPDMEAAMLQGEVPVA